MVRRIEPLAPSEANARICDRNVRYMWHLSRYGLQLKNPVSWSGQDMLPRDTPLLFLSNHVSLFDPFMAILGGRRCIHYLATQSAMTQRVLGTVLRNYGAVPKKKFTSDTQAIRNLKRWAELGRAVGLFPEGQRSWDGRLLDFIPGIETLVRLIDAPVVTFRIHNADRQWPRWAEGMRRGRVHLDFDEPRSFARGTDPQEILRHVRERLTIDPSAGPRWPVHGKDLAQGLENPLFACPRCLAFESLRCRGDDAECARCGDRWRVDTDNVLHGRAGAPTYSIVEAIDRVHEHYARAGVADAARYGVDGVVLESERTTLLDVTHDTPIDLGQGRLRLTADALQLVDSPIRWNVPLAELASVSVELRRRLQFRTPEGLFEAVMPRESVVKWEWFTERWRRAAQPPAQARLAKRRERAPE